MHGSAIGIAPALVVGMLLVHGMPARGAELSAAARGTAADAVVLARSGRHDEALRLLAELRTTAPDDLRLIHDETTVLGWAGKDDAVLANARLLEPDEAPAYVAVAVAKSARNLGRYDDAEAWYRRAIEDSPNDADARIGLAMTLADRGEADAARDVLAVLPPAAGDSVPALLARAYVEQRAGRPLDALRLYDEALEEQPSRAAALRGKALMLRALLLPSEALELAARRPGILTEAEIARLRADEAALKVRLTSATPYPPELREAAHRRTLDDIDRALAQLDDPAARAALHADRVVALVDAGRPREAVEQFERLQAGTDRIPRHAVAAAAVAHLRLKHADAAVELLREAADRNPDDAAARFDLVFAYLDAERHDEALTLARSLAARFPLIPGEADDIAAKEQRLRANVLVALVEAYSDQLADAQTYLEALAENAPHNPDVRHELANVYRWRGWLDRAQLEYRRVLSAHPELLGARIGYAHARLDAAAYDEVGQAAVELHAAYPNDPGVRRLRERLELERRGELAVGVRAGDASGATFGNEQRDWSASWVTGPIGRFHGVARYDDLAADFPEGEGRLRRFGVGTEYRTGRWRATGLLSNASDRADVGLLATADWRLDDHWRVSGSLDLNSAETPLRGRRVGTDGDVLGLGAEYRLHEGAAVGVGWRYRDFSDGNAGDAWFADGRKRLINEPRWKLELTGELSGSRNDRGDVPYFSPRHDLGALLGARHEWRLFRRYDRSVVQVAAVEAGRYDQADFASGRIWRVRYGLRFELGPAMALDVGAQRTRMFYDGQPEFGTYFTLDVTARL